MRPSCPTARRAPGHVTRTASVHRWAQSLLGLGTARSIARSSQARPRRLLTAPQLPLRLPPPSPCQRRKEKAPPPWMSTSQRPPLQECPPLGGKGGLEPCPSAPRIMHRWLTREHCLVAIMIAAARGQYQTLLLAATTMPRRRAQALPSLIRRPCLADSGRLVAFRPHSFPTSDASRSWTTCRVLLSGPLSFISCPSLAPMLLPSCSRTSSRAPRRSS